LLLMLLSKRNSGSWWKSKRAYTVVQALFWAFSSCFLN
jgi:hypothetical protein